MEKLKLCCISRIVLVFSVLFFLTCCINPDYDLGNLVKHEVNILEDISLPIGDIDMLTLEQVLFKDGELPQSVRKNEAGDLYLDLFSETFTSSFYVPSSFCLNNFDFDGVYIDLQTGAMAGQSTASLPQMTIAYSSLNSGKPFEVISPIEVVSSLPSELYDVKNIDLDAAMKCYLQVIGAPVTLKSGFEIVFPDFICLEKGDNVTAYSVVNGHILRFNSDYRLEDANVNFDNTLELSVLFDRINIPAGSVKTDYRGSRYISIEDIVKMTGDFSFNTKDVSVVPENLRLIFWMNFKISPVKSAEVSLDIDMSIDDQNIAISQIPDIFKGKNVCVDLYNPQMTLDVVNSTPLPFTMTADILADNAAGSTNKLSLSASDGLAISAASTGSYVISRRAVQVPSGTVNIVKPAISELVKSMPENIAIRNCNIQIPKDFITIQVGKVYSASVDYAVTSPLAFGEDLSLSFTQDVKNIGIELDANIKSAIFDMDLVNSIPVDFVLSAVCIDKNGNEVTGTEVTLDKEIKAGSQNSPVTTSLKLEIKNKTGKLQIEALRLTMQANAPDAAYVGIPLNEKQGFEIKDLVLTLPDGIGLEF